MVEWQAAGIIVALGIAVITLIVNENHRIRKRNEEVIDDIYDKLIADINESIHNYEIHHKIPATSYHNFLELRNLIKNHSIIKIKEVNKKTYEHLIEVEKEIIPKLVKHDEMKREVYKKIQNDWITYLEKLPQINNSNRLIASDLYQRTYLVFFKDELEEIRVKYNEVMMTIKQSNPNASINSYPLGTIDTLIRIVEKNVKEIKELDKQIRELFTSIIKEKLLPQMDKDIQDTVK